MSPILFEVHREADRVRESFRAAVHPARLARLHKQDASMPSRLRVRDAKLVELLALAGAGGSY